MSDAGDHQPADGPTEDLEDLYENAPCGYLSMRADGRVFKVNATLAAWTGYPAADIVGNRMSDLLSIGTRIFYETNVAPLLRLRGSFDETPLELTTVTGTRLPILANAVERRDAQGNHLFTRLTVFKAGERRRHEREMVEAREAANAAMRQSVALANVTQRLLDAERETAQLREQFIAVLGHDLRNPLASIGSGVRLLAKEPLGRQGARLLDLMDGSVQRMSALIDDVLDFARGRLSGGIPLSLQEVDLAPVLEQVVAELRGTVSDRDIEADIDLPAPVDCDPNRIGQMVSNLLGNAVTHGAPEHPVRLHAGVSGDVMELWVSNGGKPISPAAMDRLFQPFFRGEIRTNQRGLGLGLHIASEIARAHGGTLAVKSEASETRFTFRMPLHAREYDAQTAGDRQLDPSPSGASTGANAFVASES